MKQRKKRMKKVNKVLMIFLLLISFFLPFVTPVSAANNKNTIYISNADDLTELSKHCSFDIWSVNKTVILQNDISLNGVDFEPIPSFGGTFEGNGHTIRGLNITASFSPAALFARVQKGAIIKDLNVEGVVIPTGDNSKVGGIVGINSGKLVNCHFSGTVKGENKIGGLIGENETEGELYQCSMKGIVSGTNDTGGIVGYNVGTVSGCTNEGSINTESVNPSINISDIDIDVTATLTDLIPDSDNNSITSMDTGGIAGYSSGMIINCSNNGTIGYPHIGYNIGGITGRSCGYIANSSNKGNIYGRKDVGGIAGQMEPYITIHISEDTISRIRTGLNELETTINQTADDLEHYSSFNSDYLDEMLDYIDDAKISSKNLEDYTSDYAEDVADEIDRVGIILSNTFSSLTDISDSAVTLSEKFTEGLDGVKESLSLFADAAAMSVDVLENMKSAVDEFDSALKTVDDGMRDITGGIKQLDKAFEIEDKKAAKASLKQIEDGLSTLINANSEMSKSVEKLIKILKNNGWTEDATKEFADLSKVLKASSDALSEIYSNVNTIRDNIEVHWDKAISGKNQVLASLDEMIAASDEVSIALDKAEEGITEIGEGIERLISSVSIKDEAAVSEAISQISEGMITLSDAAADFSKSMNKLAEALTGISSLDDMIEKADEIATAISDMAEAANEASSALNKIGEQLQVISENVSVDTDAATDGAKLINNGFNELADSAEHLKRSKQKNQ